MDIQIHLRDGKRVDAEVGGFTIVTDQPASNGGGDLAPDPFTLFLASIGACAGYYVSAYCRARGIATEGIEIRQHVDKGSTGQITHIGIQIALPEEFPDAHREGVLRAANSCKVKKTLAEPPPIEIAEITRTAAHRSDRAAPPSAPERSRTGFPPAR